MKKKLLGIAGGLVLVLSLALNVFLYQKARLSSNTSLVAKVHDGDTFTLSSGQSFRLINVETPELEFCGGEQAKQELSDLILGKLIKYEIVSHDVFNRPLTLAYVGKTLVNEVLLKKGLARYDGTPSPERDKLKQAYDYAFEKKLGIHSSLCRAEKPDNPKCLIKGNIDKHSDTKTYYFLGCSNYQQTIVEKDLGENWFCSEKEAEKAGFQKSKNCHEKIYKPTKL